MALQLKESLPFLTRFRLRVTLENLPSFLTLFLGLFFANVLLYFGLMLPVVLESYQRDIETSLVSEYQVLLTMEDRDLSPFERVTSRYLIQTETEGAEGFCITPLRTSPNSLYKQEDISVYGVKRKSAYLPLPWEEIPQGSVFVSEELADKYHLKKGDSFTMEEPYGEKVYTFTVGGTAHYPAALSIFLPIGQFRTLFEHENWFLNGYFSNHPIEDLPQELIAAVVDCLAMTKVSRQLDYSLGPFADLVVVFSVIFFILLLFLLIKLMMEKNARSISLVKILGGNTWEIAGLYLLPVTITVILSILGTIPLADALVRKIFEIVLVTEMTGWIPLYTDYVIWGKMALFGFLCYALVAVLEARALQKVPLSVALKDVM